MNHIARHITLSAIAALSIAGLCAQSLEEFTSKLSIVERNEGFEPFRYSNVEINADSSAREALHRILEQQREERGGEGEQIAPATKQGYRIGIFFSNNATARAAAMEVVSLCDSLLTDLPTTMSYDNPYFKVSTGYCATQEEAVMMLHRVQQIFPRAYLMREEITPQELITSRQAEVRAYELERERELEREAELEREQELEKLAKSSK